MVKRMIINKARKRAGQSLKGGRKSSKRVWSDDKGRPETVRASKDTSSGVMREVVGGKGKKQQASPAAQRKRKAEGQQAADLMQPAAGTVGRGAEQADAGLRSSKVAAKKASDFDKALAKKEKQLENYKNERDSLTGKDKIKFIAESKSRIDSLKASIKDMKSRGGPGGRSKIKYKAKGGKTDPYAEGTGTPKGTKGTPPPSIFDQKKKKKNYGGKVMYKKHGGKVGGSDGNKLVASCYD